MLSLVLLIKEKWFLQQNILGVFKAHSFEHIDEIQVKQLGYTSFIRQQNTCYIELNSVSKSYV